MYFLRSGLYLYYSTSSKRKYPKIIYGNHFHYHPPFAMWILSFPFIQEKFGDEKLLRRFESLLATPISLPNLWAGKIFSIFLLSYPIIILVVILFSLTWYFLTGLNPILILSIPVWLMVLLISPMLPMIYTAFSSWSILDLTIPIDGSSECFCDWT